MGAILRPVALLVHNNRWMHALGSPYSMHADLWGTTYIKKITTGNSVIKVTMVEVCRGLEGLGVSWDLRQDLRGQRGMWKGRALPTDAR